MGLIHGSAPHAYVFVHKAKATHVEGYPDHLPELRELIELHERMSLASGRPRVAAVALHTGKTDEDDARRDPPESRRKPASRPTILSASGADTLLDAVLEVGRGPSAVSLRNDGV